MLLGKRKKEGSRAKILWSLAKGEVTEAIPRGVSALGTDSACMVQIVAHVPQENDRIYKGYPLIPVLRYGVHTHWLRQLLRALVPEVLWVVLSSCVESFRFTKPEDGVYSFTLLYVECEEWNEPILINDYSLVRREIDDQFGRTVKCAFHPLNDRQCWNKPFCVQNRKEFSYGKVARAAPWLLTHL